jgi:sugar phosphate isomerase/epimerase
MIAYGFAGRDIGPDLAIAARLGVATLEIFPDWRAFPDPGSVRTRTRDAGFTIHSAHGCWGGQSIRAARVDLGDTAPEAHRASVADLKRCIDWLAEAWGRCLVVHPGGLSDPAQFAPRRDALGRGLIELADHARGTGVVLCVENMPPGVHPGSRMAEIAGLVAEINRPEVGLAIDTGHANITADAHSETLDAGRWLRTTHVHDNDGRQDAHLPPGLGTVNWGAWAESLDAIDYEGPVMLECIRHFRRDPDSISGGLLELLRTLRGVQEGLS